ncbi:MAG TPA: hypothetical protein VGQ76_06815 [Thermoanaerobaculia bacterium]|nr:hypothetical protein [Thermoanaerobaculia bacterium]
MNKILVGVIAGAILGAIDGATAWFTPAVRSQILMIIISSSVKGMLAGIAAGWYARRVQSVPKGIAFGFVVGLLLAFAVAAMPGNHYWWQIMVPGSILGGVIGWATQRYGRPISSSRSVVSTTLMLMLILFGANAYAHDHPKPATNVAFEKLKSLAGTWSANVMSVDGAKATVEYRVTAGGSALMETMFVGEPHEMVNVYTVDGDALMATHYCSAQNQPVLKLNAEKSSADRLVFDLVKVTGNNTDAFINGVQIKFGADGKVEEEWHSNAEAGNMRLFLNTRR